MMPMLDTPVTVFFLFFFVKRNQLQCLLNSSIKMIVPLLNIPFLVVFMIFNNESVDDMTYYTTTAALAWDKNLSDFISIWCGGSFYF